VLPPAIAHGPAPDHMAVQEGFSRSAYACSRTARKSLSRLVRQAVALTAEPVGRIDILLYIESDRACAWLQNDSAFIVLLARLNLN